MARVHGRAHALWGEKYEVGDHPEWKLIFKQGKGQWERNLRIGGYYAGHSTLSAMKKALSEELELQRLSSGPQSPTDGRDDDGELDGEESLSERSQCGFDDYDDDDETVEHHKRRKTTVAAFEGEGEEDVPSLRYAVDGRRDKVPGTRVDNRNTSLIPWEPDPEFSSEIASRSLFEKRDVLALPAPRESNRARDGNALSGKEFDNKVRKVMADKKASETVADMYVLKCGDCLVSITNLPIIIEGTVSGGTGDQDIFLTGRIGAVTKSFPVDMWKLLFSHVSDPCLMVKTTRGFWLRLRNPHPSYLKTMSDAYILAHFLDYVKKLPSASVIAVEKYLGSVCSMYGQGPFLAKLSKHLRLIRSFVEEDEDLKRASVLRTVFSNLFTEGPTELRGDSSHQSRQVLRSVLGLYGHGAQGNGRGMDSRRQDVMWGDASSPGGSSSEEYVPGEIHADQGMKTKKRTKIHESESIESEDKKVKRSRPSKVDRERHDIEKAKNDERSPSWAVGGKRSHLEDSQILKEGGASRPKGERKSSQRSQTKSAKRDDPPICVLCDDGGDLLICDGPCSRYFHAFPETGKESFCQTLGLSAKETKAERWYCKNCEHKQQQCFICNVLGSTDTSLGRPEVYMCEVPSCKRFYHAHCVAELVDFPNWRTKANGIRNGTERLICPRHKCDTCRVTEMTPGNLVQCRRCPKAWHRDCFTDYNLSGELRSTTIWNHDQQEFVYCRQHKINPTLMTPNRDHIIFPRVPENDKMKKSRSKAPGLDGAVIERQDCENLLPTSLAADIGLNQ